MTRRYIRDKWEAPTPLNINRGDYVVATKYKDGDPGDQFCIGFYDCSFHVGPSTRHLVTDADGKPFRHNGFRRIARVGKKRGEWMVANLDRIEAMRDQFSVWHWWRAPWRVLNQAESKP